MQADALNTPWQQSDSYRCLDCGAPFNSEPSLDSHVQKCHPDTITYTCPHCSLGFLDSLQLSLHLPTHQSEEVNSLEDSCNDRQQGSYMSAYSTSFGYTDLSTLQVTDWPSADIYVSITLIFTFPEAPASLDKLPLIS